MFIFLSHNNKDKNLVEPIAVLLKNTYGKDNVFYDSWSIRPGDGIIEKMNYGLEKCDYFFFFVSNNSLSSEMVKLEWQNALMKKSQKNIRFVPIRIDSCVMPAILMQTLYIDFNRTGFDYGCRQIIDVINGNDSNNYNNVFDNFSAELKTLAPNHYLLTISVKNYFEPEARFLIFVDQDVNKITINCKSDSSREVNQWNDLKLGDGSINRAFYEKSDRGLSVGFPYILELSSTCLENFNILSLMRAQNANEFKKIDIRKVP